MHIAIEGLDGAGKTSAAKGLASELGYRFQECPIYDLVGRDGVRIFFENLSNITGNMHDELASLIFGAGNLYLQQLCQGKNIVTDRHLCSTYLFNVNGNNMPIFDFLVANCPKPDLTVILYADGEVRRNRIIDRNPNDPDLNKDIFTNEKYCKAIEFVKRYEMNYMLIDNTNMSCAQTIETIIKEIKKL